MNGACIHMPYMNVWVKCRSIQHTWVKFIIFEYKFQKQINTQPFLVAICQELSGINTDPYRACIADVAHNMDRGSENLVGGLGESHKGQKPRYVGCSLVRFAKIREWASSSWLFHLPVWCWLYPRGWWDVQLNWLMWLPLRKKETTLI